MFLIGWQNGLLPGEYGEGAVWCRKVWGWLYSTGHNLLLRSTILISSAYPWCPRRREPGLLRLVLLFFQRCIHFSREKIPTKRKHDRAEVRPRDHTLRNSNELPLCHYRTKTLFVSSEILDIYTDRCCGSFPAICSRIAPLCLLFGLDYFFTKKSLAVWVDVADFFFGVIPMR